MILNECIYGEIIFREILQLTIEQKTIIDGEDEKIYHRIDMILEMIGKKGSDHAQMIIMYLVYENGEI
jgi:hypothetical protein